MLKVGITGGIGSGKSTICRIFEMLGVPVFQADQEAKHLMDTDPELRGKIRSIFGDDIYLSNQALDRKKLAAIVFNQPHLLQQLNELVHPAVREYFSGWCQTQTAPYVLHEAAILFESGLAKLMDVNVLVTAPEDIRIARVVARDKVSGEEVKARIRNQMPEDEKRNLADYIIENDDRKLVIPQVLELDKKLRAHD